MEYINISDMNTKEAVDLAIAEYKMECRKTNQLMQKDFTSSLTSIIEELKNCRYAKAAVIDGKLAGYLGFWGPWDGFFGNCKGAFSPLGAHAFGDRRGMTASKLFAIIAKQMEEEEVYSYALSQYAHDEELATSFVMNGFGIRCSDAILRVADYKTSVPSEKITCREILPEEKYRIKELFNGLTLHLAASPCFFPSDLSTDAEWFQKDSKRVIIAEEGNTVIGYMAIQNSGENFVTDEDNMYSICGAYVAKEYRNTGAAKQILDSLVHICIKERKEYLGVDCETLNPTALHFWGKYFQNYTYSFHRRIDERVHNFQDYFNQFYKN